MKAMKERVNEELMVIKLSILIMQDLKNYYPIPNNITGQQNK